MYSIQFVPVLKVRFWVQFLKFVDFQGSNGSKILFENNSKYFFEYLEPIFYFSESKLSDC